MGAKGGAGASPEAALARLSARLASPPSPALWDEALAADAAAAAVLPPASSQSFWTVHGVPLGSSRSSSSGSRSTSAIFSSSSV
jgi:hypothetical protein